MEVSVECILKSYYVIFTSLRGLFSKIYQHFTLVNGPPNDHSKGFNNVSTSRLEIVLSLEMVIRITFSEFIVSQFKLGSVGF